MNDALICFLTFVGVFTLPYAYFKHKKIADEKLTYIKFKVDEAVHAIMSRIPESMQIKNARGTEPKAS